MSKYHFNILLMGLCLFALMACGNKASDEKRQDAKTIQTSTRKRQKPQAIQIYSYGKTVNSKAMFLKQELEKYYPSVELVDQPLTLPDTYYNKERNRYSGTGLLNNCRGARLANLVCGL